MDIPDGLVPYAKQTLGLPAKAEVELHPFMKRGSDRDYFRLTWNNTESVVLVHYNPTRRENAYFAEIARFFETIDIPTTRILDHDPSNCFIIMEDLGDVDLHSLQNTPWENRRTLYRKTLTIALRLHSYPALQFPANRVQLAEPFGPSLYRWERNYFMENFVELLCRTHPASGFRQQLETELAALAERLSALPRRLVHRDLQSPNVMIFQDEPYLIDFQGMRFGTLFYDLGSLLYDPYAALSEDEREDLLLYYFQQSKTKTDWDDFRQAFMEASAQRLMQALGAYGFQGSVRGIRDYLDQVRPGLGNLLLVLQHTDTLPHLHELASQCRDVLSGKDWHFDI
ncbi:MAG: phosphotransferase [Acidobacteria bacterium]|nr:phosphotransferase [Acidobacteriota bacterium]